MIRKIICKENGSITLFVLISILFFLFVVFGMFMRSSNSNMAQTSEIDQIKEEYEKSVNNIDQIYNETLVQNLSNLLQPGDYINYTYDTVTEDYSLPAIHSGYTNDQTISQTTGLKWQILNIDTEKKTIDLIANISDDNLTTTEVHFSGALGYNNGVYFLNDICKKQYSNSNLGIEARSINSEDIENQMNEVGIATINSFTNNESGTKYGKTYTYGNDANSYPSLYAKQNGSGINTTTLKKDGISRSDIGLNFPTTTTYYTADEGLTVTQTFYSFNNTPSSYFSNINAYNVLFETNTKKGYWLASHWNNCHSNYTDFGLFLIERSYVMQGKDLFRSTVYNNNGAFYIRPLVTIDIDQILLCTGTADGENETIEHMHQIKE